MDWPLDEWRLDTVHHQAVFLNSINNVVLGNEQYIDPHDDEAAAEKLVKYDGYLRALEDLLDPLFDEHGKSLDPLDLEDPENRPSTIFKAYGDIVKLHTLMRDNRAMTYDELVEETCADFFAHEFSEHPGAGDPQDFLDILRGSVELVAWIWLMVDMRGSRTLDEPPSRGSGRMPGVWKESDTIDEAVMFNLQPFSKQPEILVQDAEFDWRLQGRIVDPMIVNTEDKAEDYDKQCLHVFRLRDIQRLSRTKIEWTDNLLDHLLVQPDPDDEYGSIVSIYDNSEWMPRASDPVRHEVPLKSSFYQEAAKEALETLALLIPTDDDHVLDAWYTEDIAKRRGPGGMWLTHQDDEDMQPKRRLRDYRIWRHRLLKLEEAFNAPSQGFLQAFVDKRDGARQRTVWFAFLAFLVSSAALSVAITSLGFGIANFYKHSPAAQVNSTVPAPAIVTSNSTIMCFPMTTCPTVASAITSSTRTLVSSASTSQASSSSSASNTISVYPATYSWYDVQTGAIDFNKQGGKIMKTGDGDDITTILVFDFPITTAGRMCQLSFRAGSDITLSGSQEFDVFASNARPVEDTKGWPSGNLRDVYVSRMVVNNVAHFVDAVPGHGSDNSDFECPGGSMIAYELVGVSDIVYIAWNKSFSGPYVVAA